MVGAYHKVRHLNTLPYVEPSFSPGARGREDIPLLLEGKSSLNGIYFPMQLTDWLLVEVALLLIGLTKIS